MGILEVLLMNLVFESSSAVGRYREKCSIFRVGALDLVQVEGIVPQIL